MDANRLEVNGLAKLTLLDRHSEENRRNMVAACAIVFVPCHNQKAIVRFDKLDIGAKIILSQVSACEMVPSCMSSLRFGMTKEIVGKVVKLLGKLVKGWLLALGTLEKSTHGLCLRISAGSADSGSG